MLSRALVHPTPMPLRVAILGVLAASAAVARQRVAVTPARLVARLTSPVRGSGPDRGPGRGPGTAAPPDSGGPRECDQRVGARSARFMRHVMLAFAALFFGSLGWSAYAAAEYHKKQQQAAAASHAQAAQRQSELSAAIDVARGDGAQTLDEATVLRYADALYDAGKTAELYALLSHWEPMYAGSGELLWRLARATRDMAQISTDKALAKKLVYRSLECAQRALSLAPANFAVHKWYAIALSNVGDYEGIRAKIQNAFTIREHFDRARTLNPADATTRYLLGVWCFTFANMPWYERQIAATLFATPPQSTYEEALEHFLSAEKLEPGFYKKNTLMIGKVYARQDRRVDAKRWLEACLAQPIRTMDDQEAHAEAQTLLRWLEQQRAGSTAAP